jgi:uncharacterized repeat protein (TIGR01451 family)
MRSRIPRHAARAGSRGGRVRLRARVLECGLAAFAIVGLVAYAAPAAYGHTNPVVPGSSCQNGAGSGWSIKWTVQNDENVSESVTVTAVTGGLSTLNTTTFSIAPTPPGQPDSSTTIVQTLPSSATGSVTLSFTGTWSDGVTNSNSGSYALSSNPSCGAPVQTETIGGQIYLCSSGNPTTTSVPGGKLAATGPQDVSAVADPMAPTSVPAGSYSMTATAPPGYTLVACRGSAEPAADGLTATEAVAVPAGGNGEGTFYAAAPTVIPPLSASSISLHQSATRSSFSAAGQVITYDYMVSNTGNGALSKVTVAHPRTGSTVTCPESTLFSGSEETCTASYLTTSSDISAGEIVNTATATGTTSTGSIVTSSPSTLAISNQGTDILTLDVTSDFTNYNAVDEPIPFHYEVTNTSETETIDGIAVNSSLNGAATCPDATLAPLAKEKCHAVYHVTQADLNAGSITDKATASGTIVDGPPVSSPQETLTLVSVQEISGHIFQCFSTGPTDLEVGPPFGTLHAVGPSPSTAVVYSGPNPIHPKRPVASGDYTMTATNPPGWVFVPCPAQGTNASTVTNATISPDGGTATETVPVPNGGVGTGDFFAVHAAPGITMKKSVAEPYFTGAGQSLTFDFLVKNTGNIGLDNVHITDTLAGVTGLTCPESVLPATQSETCTGNYTTTADDVKAQSIVNHATASGTPPRGTTLTSTPASAATAQLLAVSVNKTASPTSIAAGSKTPIVYTLTVQNTGKVTTPTPMNIADSAPAGTTMVSGSAACAPGGTAACTVAVAAPTVTWTIAAGVTPGQKYTLTFNVTANASDPTGNIVNTALWNGAACPAGSCTTDTVTVPVAGTSSSSSSSSSSSASKLAFTGAMLAQQWMVGLGVILVGGALLVATHRRRNPKHAAATRWGLLEVLLIPQRHRRPSGERED